MKTTDVRLKQIKSTDQFPGISTDDVIIDAIFGSGLTRPAEGLAAGIIKEINRTEALKISIDMPSGLFGEDNSMNNPEAIVRADYTLCFQFPRLSFMFAENFRYTGEWFTLPIGLHNNAIRDTRSPFILLGNSDVLPLLKKRKRFDHKGSFGHGLLVAGSSGKIGACILGAGAALRSGIGLLTCHIPFCGALVMPGAIPEAMIRPDRSTEYVSDIGNTDHFSAVGAGPGLGTGAETQNAIQQLLKNCRRPVVLDADALNILSMHKDWLSLLQPDTILTPHPKEFERLAGSTDNGFARLDRQLAFSREHNCIVILKGAFTSITTSDGTVFFNSTGNPGMATAGSGDVLTGILLSLLAQGLTPVNAAVAGVYLHGLAGDIAAAESSFESLIASDIINCLGKAFNRIRES